MRHAMAATLSAGLLAVGLGCGGLDLDTGTGQLALTPPTPLEAPELEPVADFPARLPSDLLVVGTGGHPIVVQYSDWKCPHCFRALPTMRSAVEAAGGTLIYRNFPLASGCNPGVTRADPIRCELALASVCAHADGEFWAFADAVEQAGAVPDATAQLPGFGACMADPATEEAVRAQATSGQTLGVQGTPAIYVDQGQGWVSGRADEIATALGSR